MIKKSNHFHIITLLLVISPAIIFYVMFSWLFHSDIPVILLFSIWIILFMILTIGFWIREQKRRKQFFIELLGTRYTYRKNKFVRTFKWYNATIVYNNSDLMVSLELETSEYETILTNWFKEGKWDFLYFWYPQEIFQDDKNCSLWLVVKIKKEEINKKIIKKMLMEIQEVIKIYS